MNKFVVVHDIVNPETGKTYKEENLEKQHQIPLGDLVELISDDDNKGVRLYVVFHGRDCDGTPLYAMSADKSDTKQINPMFANPSWVHGWPEDCLKRIG